MFFFRFRASLILLKPLSNITTTSTMKGGNEHKNNIAHRPINSSIKSQRKKEETRSKLPVRKFQYQLPKSFFDAVDDARVEAGYDILPRLHHLSLSPSPHRQTPPSSSAHRSKKQQQKHHHQNGHKHSHSSSRPNKEKISGKKVRFHRSNPEHSHHHRPKDLSDTSSAISSSRSTISHVSHDRHI